ncbi:DUF305 domain-containing protein [Pontibacter sp. KCTC 32443]|uniref:DUF305 domain-containing protein n=1 Tax=Pontibacter TaxID=323449 RepID=UPI00164DA225|nr:MULTISPECIES: DUF305 domain-containing protein [Pontibacter]MBC5774687.1 DUF305 domain-containing protein [Pontibacter sp. KCTC 32443]
MKKLNFKKGLVLFSCLMAFSFTACNENAKTVEETTTETEETTTGVTTTDTAATTGMDTTGAGGGMMAHMHKNMEEMRGMRTNMTGDPDYDFAQMMVMHHQGAVRMADDEIANGTDTKMKQMAQKTKETNQADIKKLQDFTSKHKPTKGDTATTSRMMQPMGKMMGDMHKNMGDMSSMNTDQNFAQMMIHHHEMGNEMAREFLKQGKTQEMKQMAQKTIDQQTKEIKELQNWQQQNK